MSKLVEIVADGFLRSRCASCHPNQQSNPHQTRSMIHGRFCSVSSGIQPGLRSANTGDYIKHRTQSEFVERCFIYAGPAAWNSYLRASNSLLTLTDFNSFLSLIYFVLLFDIFVSAPGKCVSVAEWLECWTCDQ